LDVENVETSKDTPHPTEKGRTLIADLEKKIDGYTNKLDRNGNDFYNTNEIGKMRAELRKEYFPNFFKPKRPSFKSQQTSNVPETPTDPKQT
jgi:hypothetical protein